LHVYYVGAFFTVKVAPVDTLKIITQLGDK